MSSKNPQADYDQALALKDAGNACFKSGDLKGALKNYSRIFMHIGMNPCMNMSQMMGGGGAPPDPSKSQPKDPLQQKTDALRLNAFNNMAAVYAKMEKWEDVREKCDRVQCERILSVLKSDDKNIKALFRRGMANRKLNLYELARADLEKAKKVLNGKPDRAIDREMKLLDKDEKNADKIFYAKMKKQMQKAQKKKAKKKAEKAEQKKKAEEEEAKKDDNPNVASNARPDDNEDEAFVWDIPEDTDKQQTNDTQASQPESAPQTQANHDKESETQTANDDNVNSNDADINKDKPSEF